MRQSMLRPRFADVGQNKNVYQKQLMKVHTVEVNKVAINKDNNK